MIYKSITFNGKQIHYQDEGQGDKVLVLLHGFMNSLEIWATYTYSYIYLWEDGLYNGSANGNTIYGYWYNRNAEGEPCLVMKATDGNDMVCEATKGDKYYDYCG